MFKLMILVAVVYCVYKLWEKHKSKDGGSNPPGTGGGGAGGGGAGGGSVSETEIK